MVYWWKAEDPEASSEEKKYEYQAPSRTFILEYLQKNGSPMTYSTLSEVFELKLDIENEALKRRLKAMCRDGQLFQNKRLFCVPSETDMISGIVQGHKDGFGFIIPDDKSQDFFLTKKQMSTLFDGDHILVQENQIDSRKRRWCSIIKIKKRFFTEIAGVYHSINKKSFLCPDVAKHPENIIVTSAKNKPKDGDVVLLKIEKYPVNKRLASGVITKIIGSQDDPMTEVNTAIFNYQIPYIWPKAIKQENKKLPLDISSQEVKKRVDLRHLPFITIDGEDAKDFDDAVYATTKKSGGWRLYVAIADVSYYVSPQSALDLEAQNRGNSVYFTQKVIPMLPEKLSNGLCSLVPNEDRCVLVCEMTISAKGKLGSYVFYEALIHSQARLTYTKVAAIIENNTTEKDKFKKYSDITPHIFNLFDLYSQLKKVRKTRGAIDFDTVETKFIFNKKGKVIKIEPIVRNEAHKLIEECMLCANQSAAKFLKKHDLLSLFRVHKGPTEKKLESLYAFLGEKGLSLSKKETPTPDQYQKLLESIRHRKDVDVIQSMLLRSLSQAEYDTENEGHFGLAYDEYTHFTSPIRRYPDLLVHRAIKYIINSNPSSKYIRLSANVKPLNKENIYPYDESIMKHLADECSVKERRAEEATRDVSSALKCHYLTSYIGKICKGKIYSVMNFGLFVELEGFYTSGLVHVTSLPKDFYQYNKSTQRLIGEHTRKTFNIGLEVEVKIINVDIEQRKIDLELFDKKTPSTKVKNKKSR